MEHSPNAAEGTLLGPTFLYSTFKLILPCLCLSPIPQKSPGCSWLPGAVQSSSTEDQKGNKITLIPELWLCKHTQLDTAAGQQGVGDGGASADISFDKQR